MGYNLLLLTVLALTRAENLKLCVGPDKTECLGVEGDRLVLKNAADSSTNWAVHEAAGEEGGKYLQNLVTCKVATTEQGGGIKMQDKSGIDRQSWLLEVVPSSFWWRPGYIRLVDVEHTYDVEEPGVALDTQGGSLTFTQVEEAKTSQQFYQGEADYENSSCSSPHSDDGPAAHSVFGTGRACNRRQRFINGRCQKIFGRVRRLGRGKK